MLGNHATTCCDQNSLFSRVPKARSVINFSTAIFPPMPQSLSKVYIHIVFSTKNRIPMILEAFRPNAQAYFVEVGANLGSYTEEIFMMPNHTHWLCTISRTQTISDLVKNVKIASSAKMKEFGVPDFSWQKGYGAFSVSQCKLEIVKRYIQNQHEHHKKINFNQNTGNF
jgi:putative transposase